MMSRLSIVKNWIALEMANFHKRINAIRGGRHSIYSERVEVRLIVWPMAFFLAKAGGTLYPQWKPNLPSPGPAK